jgi:hypothetical protein
MEKIQIEMSDVLSFHDYGKPEEFEERIHWLQGYRRFRDLCPSPGNTMSPPSIGAW